MSEYFLRHFDKKFFVKNKIRGYSDEELAALEVKLSIRIQGELREFLSNMGKCSGKLFGDSSLVFYEGVGHRNSILIQKAAKTILADGGDPHFAEKPGVFCVSYEDDGEYTFFLDTMSSEPDCIWLFDTFDNFGKTEMSFLDYAKSLQSPRLHRNLNPRGYLIEGDMLNDDFFPNRKS